MSYMSGLMLGASAGKQLRNLFAKPLPKQGQQVALDTFILVHALPARRRYRVSRLAGNQQLADLLEQQLIKLKFITKVEVNVITGSIVFYYSGTEQQIDDLAGYLKKHIFLLNMDDKTESLRFGQIRSKQKMYESLKIINEWIQRKTAGLFDLGSLLSLIFCIRGIRKILLYEQAPSGPQMLWWAFSLVRGWRLA